MKTTEHLKAPSGKIHIQEGAAGLLYCQAEGTIPIRVRAASELGIFLVANITPSSYVHTG